MEYRDWTLYVILIFLIAINGCRNSKEFVYEKSEEQLRSSVSSMLDLYADKYSRYLTGTEDTLRFPRTVSDDQVIYTDASEWTSGFFPGILWYLYRDTDDEIFRRAAEKWTNTLTAEKNNTSSYDIGFKINSSFGLGYEITGDTLYKEILIEAAGSLASRFNEEIGMIKSLDDFENYSYPVVIDNLVNLEILYKTWKWTSIDRYYNIAHIHALGSMENMFRDDHSLFQLIDYDPDNRNIRKKGSYQGYDDNSDWSRGLAWAIYGYTMCFRETGDRIFLDQAERIVHYFLNHPNLEPDLIPYWDLNAPGIPEEPRDAAAAAILTSALLELSSFPETGDAEYYLSSAEVLIKSLSSEEYISEADENSIFVLKHCTGNYPANKEVDVPLIYGDYYFLEALVKYRNLNI